MYNSGTAEGRQTRWGSTIILLFFWPVYSLFCVAKLVPPIPHGSAGPTMKCQVSKIISWSVMASYASDLFDYFEGWHKNTKLYSSSIWNPDNLHPLVVCAFTLLTWLFYRFCGATLQIIWMLCFELFPLILEISIVKKNKEKNLHSLRLRLPLGL